jgi:predicted RNase H-like HicB family nuclease
MYEELQQHPGKRYKRVGPETRRLAQDHGLNVETLAQSLVDLASNGDILKERAGREVLYFVQQTNPGPAHAQHRQGTGTRSYTVTYERDEDGFVVASVPTLPGCHSQGRTLDEAQHNIREAMRGYLASLKFRGEPLPEEVASEQVEVDA